ncbi:ATP-binding protein [Streptomyces sp. NPDC059176]|uniref:ATP-binding protein n=1 Tax=unclassified Streptomyces TaxID=2593676 RepID=UPI0036C32679
MSAALPARGQTRRLLLSGTRGVVGRCRDFSRTALADWDWLPPEDRLPDGGAHPPCGGTAGDPFAWDEDLDAPTDWDDERRAVAEDVLMVVSEMVTNACLHAGGPLELVLHCTVERLRIEVSDASPVPPTPRPQADPAVPGGHGLVVLGRLARSWGSQPRGTGKTVWAEIAAPHGP